MQFSVGVYNSTQDARPPHDGSQTPPEGGPHTGRPADLGGRTASEICKEMNISPATLKRWRDQLHLLAPPDAAKMREQEKTIEHMARVVAEQAVQIRILQMALEKKR